MKHPAKTLVSMKRPAKAEVLIKRPASAKTTSKAKKQVIVGPQNPARCPAGAKPGEPEELQLEVLLMSGKSLGSVQIRNSCSGRDLKLAIKREFLASKEAVQHILPVSNASHQRVSDDQLLAKSGLSNGSQVYAVLEDEESDEYMEDEDEESEDLYNDFSDDSLDSTRRWDQDSDPFGMDECIHGCGNRGSSRLGGECSSCYGEH
eukprot:TRINITY_DN17311_c0_g1_i1.p1 TRINITY_DN17311_c0_g1~~TRINITY_DN17311_c0_g1_i1.p1  ORF type:complete len:205 (-),score=40.13 TRINITY_DN17311_c0_g1_i1:225-839(-)